MRPSQRLYAMIREHERLMLKSYPDPASPRARHKREKGVDDPSLSGKPWTIGYGHTQDVTEGMVISSHQAEEILRSDLELQYGPEVDALVRVALNQNQFDALVSFYFNVGPGKKGVDSGFAVLKSGQPSSMLRLLNAGDYAGAAGQFMQWKYARGKVMPGLVKRRAAERALFLEPVGPA